MNSSLMSLKFAYIYVWYKVIPYFGSSFRNLRCSIVPVVTRNLECGRKGIMYSLLQFIVFSESERLRCKGRHVTQPLSNCKFYILLKEIETWKLMEYPMLESAAFDYSWRKKCWKKLPSRTGDLMILGKHIWCHIVFENIPCLMCKPALTFEDIKYCAHCKQVNTVVLLFSYVYAFSF